jgi:hypothetical protein
VSITSPGRVLAVALALALCGWIAGTRTETVSDFRELVPGNLREVRDLNELQDVTGVSGELDVSVQSQDLLDPATFRWMAQFKQRVLEQNGFRGRFPTCRDAQICPGPSVTDFAPDAAAAPVSRERIKALLAALPAYDLRGVLNGDTANIAFGIRAQSLSAQQDLIDRVRDEIDPPGPGGGPPPGVTVRLAGLPVIAAESATDLSHSRYWLTLAGAARRRPGAARRLPLGGAGAGPADPDRPRDRLVRPGAGGDGDPAQPDVGGAGRIGDRDRHRVQRDPRLPLPRGAGRRALGRRGAAARLRADRRCGAGHPGRPRSPASPR